MESVLNSGIDLQGVPEGGEREARRGHGAAAG